MPGRHYAKAMLGVTGSLLLRWEAADGVQGHAPASLTQQAAYVDQPRCPYPPSGLLFVSSMLVQFNRLVLLQIFFQRPILFSRHTPLLLQPAHDEPAEQSPGRARRPASQHVGGPVHP